MNILDENIAVEQRELLHTWGIPTRQIGYSIGRSGIKDEDIISLLHQLRRPTFFTLDMDFYRRSLCHPRYCLVYFAIEETEVAVYVRRILRHPEFDTQAKRMGSVLRVARPGISAWMLFAEQEISYPWIV